MPVHDMRGGPNPVPLVTKLFRFESYLEEGLKLHQGLFGTKTTLEVTSAGCSIGAEADSIAAIYNKLGYGGRLAITGYDINPQALEVAAGARYEVGLTTSERENTARRALKAKILSDMGFVVEGIVTRTAPKEAKRERTILLTPEEALLTCSRGVRRRHQLGFTQADLRDASQPLREADIIFANNFLMHLSPDDATAAVDNLAASLKPQGIFVIGGWQTLMSHHFVSDKALPLHLRAGYKPWAQSVSGHLREEYGLEPALSSALRQLPAAYVRT